MLVVALAAMCIGRPATDTGDFFASVADLVADATRELTPGQRADLAVVLPSAYDRQTVPGVLAAFRSRGDLSAYAQRIDSGIDLALERDPTARGEYPTAATQARVARLIVDTASEALKKPDS